MKSEQAGWTDGSENSGKMSCRKPDMKRQRVVVVGGGAAGFFAAITSAQTGRIAEVRLLEKGPQFLTKVRVSGGGRCNVTHACFDPRELAKHYPRGGRALLRCFARFQPKDTIAWFESRGVRTKAEADGRMFPTSDCSQTIIDCLLKEAKSAGVKLSAQCGLERAVRRPEGGFGLELTNKETVVCDRLLLATGGCRGAAAGQAAVGLGHTLEPPVPSLFTFEMPVPWLRDLAGISLDSAEISVPEARVRERGALLLTHWGMSGPAVLRCSAWGARALHALDYHFSIFVNWLPHLSVEEIAAELARRRQAEAARLVVNAPIAPLPARLWEQLVLAAGVPREERWNGLSRSALHGLVQQLIRTCLPVTGKSLNKEEFVTCGGIRLNEVDFNTMQSRICPGLFFAGELLDVDGITGGFNFQAAWTTGWIAGRAMAGLAD